MFDRFQHKTCASRYLSYGLCEQNFRTETSLSRAIVTQRMRGDICLSASGRLISSKDCYCAVSSVSTDLVQLLNHS
jgi:hypothetical protein